MQIGWNGRDGLVLVDVDQVFQNLGFAGRHADRFLPALNALMVTALHITYYSPGPGVTESSLVSLNRLTPDLNTGCGREISNILIS